MQLNVLKGAKEALVSKELMGRVAIPLRPFHDKPGEAVDAWYDLGKGEWSNDDGTVRAAACLARMLGARPAVRVGVCGGLAQTILCRLR